MNHGHAGGAVTVNTGEPCRISLLRKVLGWLRLLFFRIGCRFWAALLNSSSLPHHCPPTGEAATPTPSEPDLALEELTAERVRRVLHASGWTQAHADPNRATMPLPELTRYPPATLGTARVLHRCLIGDRQGPVSSPSVIAVLGDLYPALGRGRLSSQQAWGSVRAD